MSIPDTKPARQRLIIDLLGRTAVRSQAELVALLQDLSAPGAEPLVSGPSDARE